MGNQLTKNFQCTNSVKPPPTSVTNNSAKSQSPWRSSNPSSSTSPDTDSTSEPKRSTTSDSTSSPKRMPRSTRSTLRRPTSPSDTTSCPPGPTTSTRSSSVIRDNKVRSETTSPSQSPTMLRSTGEPRAPSTQSRTKLNAVHAGLSPPPAPSRVLISSSPESSSPSPSKKSSPATRPLTDVKADGNPTPSPTLSLTFKSSRPLIHMPLDTDKPAPANMMPPRVPSKLLPTKTSQPTPSPN